MNWRLENRRGQRIASGTLEQMLFYLKHLVRDGDYELLGTQITILVRRHQGVVNPFDRWKGWRPGSCAEEGVRVRRGEEK
jgi:hypothetical protein